MEELWLLIEDTYIPVSLMISQETIESIRAGRRSTGRVINGGGFPPSSHRTWAITRFTLCLVNKQTGSMYTIIVVNVHCIGFRSLLHTLTSSHYLSIYIYKI